VARLADGRVLVGRWSKNRTDGAIDGGSVAVAIRPELIAMGRPGPGNAGGDAVQIEATVRNRIFLGENTEYLVTAGALGDLLVLTPKRLEAASGGFRPGDAILIGWPEHAAVMLTED
jgi:spermidine/putrescine transport system ATP-binding protein